MPAKSKKAAAKAAPAPALVLTKPTKGVSGKKGKDRLSVDGHEKLVASMRERQAKLDSLTAQQKKDKATLIDDIKAKRLSAEKAGDFHKTVLVESADGKAAQVVFQDRFSKVDIEHEDALRGALAGNYDQLFAKGVDVKVKTGKTLQDFKDALGDKFGTFLELCETTEFLAAQKDYMTKRSALRSGLDDPTNDVIDGITEQVQVSPSVKLK